MNSRLSTAYEYLVDVCYANNPNMTYKVEITKLFSEKWKEKRKIRVKNCEIYYILSISNGISC